MLWDTTRRDSSLGLCVLTQKMKLLWGQREQRGPTAQAKSHPWQWELGGLAGKSEALPALESH